jgi:hypothetical protein
MNRRNLRTVPKRRTRSGRMIRQAKNCHRAGSSGPIRHPPPTTVEQQDDFDFHSNIELGQDKEKRGSASRTLSQKSSGHLRTATNAGRLLPALFPSGVKATRKISATYRTAAAASSSAWHSKRVAPLGPKVVCSYISTSHKLIRNHRHRQQTAQGVGTASLAGPRRCLPQHSPLL